MSKKAVQGFDKEKKVEKHWHTEYNILDEKLKI